MLGGLFKASDDSGKEFDKNGTSENQKVSVVDLKSRFLTMLSSAKQAKAFYTSLVELNEFNNGMDRLIACTTAYYRFFKEFYGITRNPNNKMLLNEGASRYEFMKSRNVKLTSSFNADSFETHQNLDFSYCIPGNMDFHEGRANYFNHVSDMKEDILESFMLADEYVLEYHAAEAGEMVERLEELIVRERRRSIQLLSIFFSNTEDGIITELIRVYVEARKVSPDPQEILELIEYVTDRYKEAVSYIEEKHEESLNANFQKLNMLLRSLRPSQSGTGLPEMVAGEEIPEALEGSLDKILEFSRLPEEDATFFRNQLMAFRNMENKDKYKLMLQEDRNRMASLFFTIYESVFIRTMQENVNDRAIDLFLTFGFMDERLLSKRQVGMLNRLLDIYSNEGNVYSVKRWLTRVYHREKSPSLNGLGIDYEQQLKEKKIAAANDSGEQRVNFEILNMIKSCHKMCYGQSSTYFPVLHSDMVPDDLFRVAVTAQKINESIQNILNIDFSAFHREAFYSGDDQVFKKELIMKQVMPDIILVPTMGTRAFMWQEIEGRNRVTPGRFIFPIFTWEDLNNMMIKITGRFRWELCKTVMSFRWNDISCKSLTSEYADYIEEYRRNKNLLPEHKEKIRAQIQQHHNNLRDIFTSDYEAWLKYEANGNRKLNREARAIFYKYCPLNHALRDEYISHPAFSTVAPHFEHERKKLARELENKYMYFVKKGHVMDPELEENLRFYREL